MGDIDTDLTKYKGDVAYCPFCHMYPSEIVDDCSTADARCGPAVACTNEKCGALGPVKKTRRAALKAWNDRG